MNWIRKILAFFKRKPMVEIKPLHEEGSSSLPEVWITIGDDETLLPCHNLLEALLYIWERRNTLNQIVFDANGAKVLVFVNHDKKTMILCGSVLSVALKNVNDLLRKHSLDSFKNNVKLRDDDVVVFIAAGLNDAVENPTESFLFPVQV